MTGKTHAAFGMASSILILGGTCGTPVDLVTGLVISSVAAVMPDIDLGGKNSGKIMVRTFIVLLLLVLFMTGIDGIFNQQLISNKPQNFVLGMGMMFILFFFGIKSPHRGFTHSILAAVLFGFSAYLIFGNYVSWFAISYISHILIDLFNKKKFSYCSLHI